MVDTSPLTHRQILVVLAGVMAGMLLAALDQSIVGTALPRIVSELGGLDKLSWVVTAYLLTSTAVTPLWGKISDLYGRRLIFQAAIGIFVIGSALSGMAQTMAELIAARAFQGVGGGGLFAIALSIIGDVIPPRERGKYQGYFAGVFGVSSIAGPLLGGWFTDGPGWRWIFFINVPIGIAALVITSSALKLPVRRREHSIDYLGAATIIASVTCLLLYLNWRGKDYGWGETGALALLAGALGLGVAFVCIELRAPEPILPMRLFRNPIFCVGNLYGFLAGIVMFGTIIFLPLYLQAVQGMSPTLSGLALLPAMVGIFATSIPAGQLISRTGRYKIFPVIGAVLLTLSLLGLSRLGADTPYWKAAIAIFLLGAGLGLTMQTILTAIQNAVDRADLGTATGATTFFRQIGGAIGAAAFGAVLASRLTVHLADEFGGNAPKADTNNVQAIQALHGAVREHVLTAFSDALDDVFFIGVPVVVLAFFVALGLKEVPLRTT
ncbi:MDR family MFS transporter [Candidatus Solirubrobacter pratensis]|uniref:MDR family MFS transporter n=1 Tax=Candidatus Solirubrobacter pratensis TaxID=1298857 RepID=UPI0003FF083F|nr:MDR family MFS transporter [Candidatus Solirubrobacter pratensis]